MLASEANVIDKYDYIIINDDLDIAVNTITQITNDEYSAEEQFNDIIEKIVNDIKEKNYV